MLYLIKGMVTLSHHHGESKPYQHIMGKASGVMYLSKIFRNFIICYNTPMMQRKHHFI
jgi:hypothetical protein